MLALRIDTDVAREGHKVRGRVRLAPTIRRRCSVGTPVAPVERICPGCGGDGHLLAEYDGMPYVGAVRCHDCDGLGTVEDVCPPRMSTLYLETVGEPGPGPLVDFDQTFDDDVPW